MPTLNQAEIEAALRELPGWAVRDGMLVKTYAHEHFPQAIVFVNAVAHLAELANHHPDIDIRYTNVTLSLVTHDQGGLTQRDVSLAGQIEALRKRAVAAA